jgi:predicted Zn-dependent peptidase
VNNDIRAVTAEDVKRVLEKTITKSNKTVAILERKKR